MIDDKDNDNDDDDSNRDDNDDSDDDSELLNKIIRMLMGNEVLIAYGNKWIFTKKKVWCPRKRAINDSNYFIQSHFPFSFLFFNYWIIIAYLYWTILDITLDFRAPNKKNWWEAKNDPDCQLTEKRRYEWKIEKVRYIFKNLKMFRRSVSISINWKVVAPWIDNNKSSNMLPVFAFISNSHGHSHQIRLRNFFFCFV